jgi:hypothetical protein
MFVPGRRAARGLSGGGGAGGDGSGDSSASFIVLLWHRGSLFRQGRACRNTFLITRHLKDYMLLFISVLGKNEDIVYL